MTQNTPTYDVKVSALPIREIYLNFGTSAAGSMLEYIFVHLDIMSAQDRIAKNREHERTCKECIQNSKRVTVSVIFCTGSSRLGQNILEVQRERKEATRVKQEGTYTNNTQEYRDKKQHINELITSLASKEVDKWSVADLKKTINWKKVNANGATPERNKDLLVLWDMVRGKTETTPPKRSKEEMGIDGEVDYEYDNNLCEGDDQNQVTSVIILFFCVDSVNILQTIKYLSLQIVHKLVP